MIVPIALWREIESERETAYLLKSEKMKPLIMADRDRVAAAGVQSTPSFLIGGEVLVGAVAIKTLRAALDAEIAKAGAAAH